MPVSTPLAAATTSPPPPPSPTHTHTHTHTRTHTHTHTHTHIRILLVYGIHPPPPQPYPGSTRKQSVVVSGQTGRPQVLSGMDANQVVLLTSGRANKVFLFCAAVCTHGLCEDAFAAASAEVLQLLILPCAVLWSKESGYCLAQLVELFAPSELQTREAPTQDTARGSNG